MLNKVLVTGANGQLGRCIRDIAPGNFLFSDVVDVEGLDTIHLDITDIDAIRKVVKDNGIDTIINCAAFTDVEKAEEECYDKCCLINQKAPEHLATVIKEVDGLLIHISTDYVYGNSSMAVPLVEDDICCALNAYGLSKWMGERAIVWSGCKYVILRTSWLYSEYGKNFFNTIRKLSQEKEEIKVVFDQVGSPTYARDLAYAIIKVLDKFSDDKVGVYNYSNEGVCSWFDFASAICFYTGCKALPCRSNEYPSKARRPNYSVMDKKKFKETFDMSVPHWSDSLKECYMSSKGFLKVEGSWYRPGDKKKMADSN